MDTSNTTGTKPTSAAAVSPDLTNHGFLPVNSKKAATPAKPPAKPTAQSGASSKNRFEALAKSNEEETFMDAVLHGRTPPEKDDAEEQGHEGETTSTSGSKRSRSSSRGKARGKGKGKGKGRGRSKGRTRGGGLPRKQKEEERKQKETAMAATGKGNDEEKEETDEEWGAEEEDTSGEDESFKPCDQCQGLMMKGAMLSTTEGWTFCSIECKEQFYGSKKRADSEQDDKGTSSPIPDEDFKDMDLTNDDETLRSDDTEPTLNTTPKEQRKKKKRKSNKAKGGDADTKPSHHRNPGGSGDGY
jgi:hypothetical protein